MPLNSTITTIVNTGSAGMEYRVLSCDLDWPAGEPPFPPGQRVTLPTIPTTPPAYNPATFNSAIWTNCTGLVSDYQFTTDAGMILDQLSLALVAGWQAEFAPAFREMRAIIIQERYRAGATVTGWLNRCLCLSDGYQESWTGGKHAFVVNAKSALKLANLDPLGAQDGSVVYQADVVSVGGFNAAEHYQLTMVNDAGDAWEYGVTTAAGSIQPNWADRPAPQFWCHNVPGVATPIPLASAGQSVQAVFGEGVIRLGKAYAQTAPGTGGFSVGLGFDALTVPDVRGVVSRFAHPATVDRAGAAVASDIIEELAQLESPAVAGRVKVTGDLRSYPTGLTLVLTDGSGARYTTSRAAMTYSGGQTTITLEDSTATIPAGSGLRYGEANLLRHLIVRVLIECGFQVADAAAPFYVHPPEVPVIAGAAEDIVLPPIVCDETEGKTAVGLIDGLRRDGFAPPNYYTYDDDLGQVHTRSIAQLAVGNAATIPLVAIPSEPGLQYDRSDLAVSTRVVAKGQARQVDSAADIIAHPAVSIALVAAADGGLETAPAWNGVPDSAALRALLNPNYVPVYGMQMRPWWWDLASDQEGWARGYEDQWRGKALCEITLPAPARISALELHCYNNWPYDHADICGDKGWRNGWQEPQLLGVTYWDGAGWRPLISSLQCPVEAASVIRVEADAFASRQAVTASRFRLIVEEPWFTHWNPDVGHFAAGVWISRIKLWASAEVRGVATLGDATNYGGEMAGEPWASIYARMRRRTYVLPDTVPWANSQDTADWLALEWLKEKSKDLAPRRLAAFRPDVRKFDTVKFTTPRGEEASYLVTATDATPNAPSGLTVVSYTLPYYEE